MKILQFLKHFFTNDDAPVNGSLDLAIETNASDFLFYFLNPSFLSNTLDVNPPERQTTPPELPPDEMPISSGAEKSQDISDETKKLSIEDIEKLKKAEAGEVEGGHNEDLTNIPYGLPIGVDSLPRNFEIGFHFEQVQYQTQPLVKPPENIEGAICTDEPVAVPICRTVYESGIKGDGVLGSAVDPHNPNNQINNPPPTEVCGNLIGDQAGVKICEITYNNIIYYPINGIICIETPAGVLVVDACSGKYDFALYNTPEPCDTASDDETQHFTYTLCDPHGCMSSSTLTIKIIDDAPIANPDAEICVNEGGSIISGNVILGTLSDGTNDCQGTDVPGADGPIKIYEIWYNNGASHVLLNGSSVTVQTDDGGSLTVNPDGSWTYTSPMQLTDDDFYDSFFYNVIDKEGHISNNGSGPCGSVEQPICVDVPPIFDCESISNPVPLTFDQVTAQYPQVQLSINCDSGDTNIVYNVNTFSDVISSKDSFLSLREAIIATNISKGTSTEVICLSSGTYNLSIAPTNKGNDNQNEGDLNFTTTKHSLIIQGEGIDATFIDANQIDRIFQTASGSTLILRDLTIVNGDTSGKFVGNSTDGGGGILSYGNLVLYNVGVMDSNADKASGGGISLQDAAIGTIINSFIEGNTTTGNGFGGGIFDNATGNLLIDSSVISNNSTERSGAGLYVNDNNDPGSHNAPNVVTIENSLIHDNQTVSGNAQQGGDGGGAIYAENTTLNINGSTIACNIAFDGGGIEAYQGNKETTIINISDSTLVNNIALGGKGIGSGTGGAILADGVEVNISNSTIALNEASRGGAIFIDHDGNIIIHNSTISSNETFLNGQSGAIDTQSHGTVELTSSIISNNDIDIIYDNNLANDADLSGKGFTSGGNNLVGNYTNGISDFSPQPTDITNADPMLGAIGDNGGPTFTMAVLSGSPAIDTGSNPDALTTDQRGETRPDAVNENPDIGAYESQALGPIILDLHDSGIYLAPLQSPVLFDANNDGQVEQMQGWVSPSNAFLVYDYNGDHNITQGDQIGFTAYAKDALTDTQGLQLAFDTNYDGIFNQQDAAWGHFGLWQDANQNGKTDVGEYLTLDEVGITGINLALADDIQHIGGITLNGVGTFTTIDGNTHQFADVALNYIESNSSNITVASNPSANVQSVESSVSPDTSVSATQSLSDITPPPTLPSLPEELTPTVIHENA